MPTFGEVLNTWTVTPRAQPFQKKQLIKVTATIPTKGLGNTRKESLTAWGTFMEVIQKAQAKWPGASISITTISTKLEEVKA